MDRAAALAPALILSEPLLIADCIAAGSPEPAAMQSAISDVLLLQAVRDGWNILAGAAPAETMGHLVVGQ